MVKIIGIRFRSGGKVYYFDPKDMEFRRGSYAIVETARGVECGRVVLGPREIEDSQVVQPLRQVIRVADEADIEHERENQRREKEAYRICRQKIRDHNLDMKLVQAEYTFDNKKMMFYFTADGRVDFRELVKDLASVFKTRIELRQIGVRDETKMLGGIGTCGRPLCCSTYLSDFAPVSIRMAKEQNLSLNPAKISGVCGRLMCCLKNEEETYEYLNRKLPGVGDVVQTPDGREGEVQSLNVLRQKVRVLIEEGDDKEVADYPAEEITLIQKRKKGGSKAQGEAEKTASADAGNGSSGKREGRDRRENRREQNVRDGSRREMRETSGFREPERKQRMAAGDRVTSGKPGRPESETEGTEERRDENAEKRSRRNRRGRRGSRDRRNGQESAGNMNREGEGFRTREESRPREEGNMESRNPDRARRRDRRRPDRIRREMSDENKES